MSYSDSRTHPDPMGPDPARAARTVRVLATVVGAVFLLVGVLGFIPGVTTDYDTLQWAGHDSDAQLLGVFEVSVLHNVVHLIFGVAGLAMARTASAATAYLVGGGVIYLVLAIYGGAIDHEGAANFIPVDNADNWLHLGLGLGMIGLGLVGARVRRTSLGAGSPR